MRNFTRTAWTSIISSASRKAVKVFCIVMLLCGMSISAICQNKFTAATPESVLRKEAANGGKPITLIENKGQITDQYNKQRKDIDYTLHATGGLNLFIGGGAIHYQFSKNDNPDEKSKIKNQKSKIPNSQFPIPNSSYTMYRMDVELVGADKNAKAVTEQKQDYYENHFTDRVGLKGVRANSYNRVTYKDVYPNIDWVLYVSGGKLQQEFVVRAGGKVSDIQLKYGGATALEIKDDGSLAANTPQGLITEEAPYTYQRDGRNVSSRYVLHGDVVGYEADAYSGDMVIDPGLAWATYYGGSNIEEGIGVATDGSGNVYMAGATESTSDIATAGAYQTTIGGAEDAFLAKFSSSGGRLWATYYGGSDGDLGNGVATDGSGNVYMTGYTNSTTGIATAGAYQTSNGGSVDAFLAKFSSSGALTWATYYGGSGDDYTGGMATDGSGNVYVTGYTSSTTGIAAAGAYQPSNGGGYDAFLAQFSSSGGLTWATYYGGSGDDWGYGVATDGSGNVYIAGPTSSTTGIATVGAYQATYGGDNDGFLAQFSSSGSLQWGTYFGGSDVDWATGVATDGSGNVYISGLTASTSGIATAGAYQATYGGGTEDAFLAQFSSSGGLAWATYYGGSDEDEGKRVATDGSGNVYISGLTASTSGIATAGAYQATYGGGTEDAFLAQFSSSGGLAWASYYGGSGFDQGLGVAADGYGNVYMTGATESTSAIATVGAYQTAFGGLEDAFLAQFQFSVQPITGATTVCQQAITSLADVTSSGTWSTANTTVATVDGSGNVTGVSAGSAVISYTSAGGTATTTVTVNDAGPTIDATAPAAICSGSNTYIDLAARTSTTSTFSWAANSPGGIVTGYTPSGTYPTIDDALTNSTSGAGTVVYTVTATNATTGCASSPTAITQTVNPAPTAISGSSSGSSTIPFVYSGAIQSFTVPAGVTTMSVTASGAQGGGEEDGGKSGGLGASMSGIFTVTPGHVLNILVGQQPALAPDLGGGGGGSFVWDVTAGNVLLIAAGGGGGAGDNTPSSGINAVTTMDGTNGGGGFGGAGTGGGGGVATSFGSNGYGGGGTGWLTNGADGNGEECSDNAGGGQTPLTGGAGGNADLSGASSPGGFGGGGGGQADCLSGAGGGGGGYSGGAGGYSNGIVGNPGGGGGSYNGGTSQSNSVANTGNGSVILSYSASGICAGSTIQLSDGVSGGTWSSSDESLATVGLTTGLVTGVATGTPVITYILPPGCSATTVVTVNTAPGSITGAGAICANTTAQLSDAIAGGSWSSSVSLVATIDPVSGIVSGVAQGTTVITYMIGSCTATTTLTVNPAATAIAGTLTVCAGSTTQLSDGVASGTWSSSDESLATVGLTTGLITGVATGTPVITYILPTGCSATTVVTVNITPGSITGAGAICAGTTTQLSNTVSGGAWSSSNSSIATINAVSGVASGSAQGATTITYKIGACTATTTLTVNQAAMAITGTVTVCAGSTTQLSDGVANGTWSSSSVSLATVGLTTGLVTGVAMGTPVITYLLPTGCSATTVVTVNSSPGSITGTGAICAGTTTQLSNTVSGGAWSSSSSSVATINAVSGVVSGSAQGATTITYKIGSCAATMTLTVNAAATAITGTVTVCAGATAQLSDGIANGTWSSSDNLLATVGLTTGLVTGVAMGTPVITYILSTGCSATKALTINASPGAIAGTTIVCAGLTTQLSDAVSGGVWTSSNGAMATVGSVSGVVTGVGAGTPTISYSIGTCRVTTLVTVNAAATAITGTVTVCAGLTTQLSDGIADGTWSSSDNSLATVGLTTGLVTGVATGTPVITYSLSTGCMTTTVMTINTSPSAISGATTVCVGYITTLSNTVSGGVWSSSNTDYAIIPEGSDIEGVAAGTPVITYATAAGCIATAPVTVNALPYSYGVNGGGAYCSGGTGVAIGLATSDMNVSYQLMDGAVDAGIAVGGTGAPISFGLQTTAGTYTVLATDVNTLCYVGMLNSVAVSITVPPIAFNVTGGGSYCSGGTGVDISLSGSVAGVSYQLYNGAFTVGSPMTGTGLVLDFGDQTTAGYYTVIATSSGCSTTMTGTVSVSINPLPTAYGISGDGSYCAGGAGVDVTLSSSNPGVNYQLVRTGSVVGSPLAGTGFPLDFGDQTAGGIYQIAAINDTTGCINLMTGLATIVVNAVPVAYNVSGGGSYCSGGTGADISLNGSDQGVNYQLYNGITPVGGVKAGTGFDLDFGSQTGAGTYTIGAVNATTGCVNTMNDSAVVTISPLPAAFGVTGGGGYCSGSTGVHVGLSFSNSGINYQLYEGASTIGTTLAGTGAALDFGLETAAGTYTILATDGTTGCLNGMSGDVVVTVDALPTAFTVTGGGSDCSSGAGVDVSLNGSTSGVKYQLYRAATAVGTPLPGTGSILDFGDQVIAGVYTVVATNTVTACTNNMTGSATVTVNTLPAVYNVTGGGSYCFNGTGVDIGLSGSASGVNYQLYDGATPIGSHIAGTGFALDFGLQTPAGNYTVIATNATTLCTNNMSGSATVAIIASPTAFTVTGGGGYCAGGTGPHIDLSGSSPGVNYQLVISGNPVGGLVAGSGFALDLGAQTTGGTYEVAAINTTTGCTNIMTGTVTVTANPLPVAYDISGGGSYCSGGTGADISLGGSGLGVNYQLYNGITAVGSVIAGTGHGIDFDLQTGAGTYTIGAVNATTGCVNTMTGNAVITISPLPAAFGVTGGGGYCAGGTGVHVGLNFSNSGINYQLYDGVTAMGTTLAGTGAALDFGLETAAGTYTILATDGTTGCLNGMSGDAVVTVDALPIAFTVTGGGSYCSSGTGVGVSLNGSTSGVKYQLYRGATTVGTALSGTGSILDFGDQAIAGVYTVVATNSTTACTNNMTGSATVTINALPAVYNITGGGSYCSEGTGVDIGLSGSASGVNYQLYNGSTPTGSPIAGTGFALDFGLQTLAGNYTVIATNAATLCTNNMSGSATVTIIASPIAFAVTGGGTECAGGTGFHVGLSGSGLGVSYQLLLSGAPVGSPVAGTGFALDFGIQTTGGTYVVSAINTTTLCTNNMTGSAVITVNPLPTAYNVTGGGSYCLDGTGVHVGLFSSDIGVNYQLYQGATAIGYPVAGTGFGLDFGLQTTVGTYTVVATNATTSCTRSMSGSATVSTNPLPTAYNVTGGGGYCAGGTGVHVYLSGSVTGVSYQLYVGASLAGTALAGSGSSLDFGLQTVAGNYTVIATNITTGCIADMAGSVNVVINPLPTGYSMNGGGSYCAGSGGVHVGLVSSSLGINYQLYRGGSSVGGPVAGTGFALDFGAQIIGGIYTAIATNTTTACTNDMPGTATVTVNPLPTAYMLAGGGGYCAGSAGADINLSGSDIGITYQLYNGASVVSSLNGTGFGLDFGPQTAAGSYTIVATNTSTGCVNTMTGNPAITINPLPTLHNVTGGGGYCAGGAGVHIGLDLTDVGINYQLYNGGSAVGGYIPGTGSSIDFGLQTVAGTYTVVATNATTSCSSIMAGKAIVVVNSLPIVYNVTGGGSYCSGDTGVHVTLNGSNAGISYQLYIGGILTGSPLAGTGGALDFGLKITAGIYTAVATNTATACTSYMSGNATVSINPLPTAYALTGGGSYCYGGTGVDVALSNSNTGISYSLYNGAVFVATMAGTNAALDFGLQTTAGTYTIVATNTTTGCINNMTGSDIVSINPLPTLYAVTGGGGYCAGGAGVHVYLNGSNTGINYQLYNGFNTVGSAMTGTGGTLDFGLQTAAGIYTVIATNTTTNCTNTMAASATVVINPLPSAISGTATVCVGSTTTLSDVGEGAWSSVNPSIATVGTGTGVVTGVAAGNATIVYRLATGCSATIPVTVNPLPTGYNVTGGGGYCAGGTGVHIGLSNSVSGIDYQLYNGNSTIGSALAGTGAALDFGLQTTAGTYSVAAANTVTGCTTGMLGNTSVVVNPLPAVYIVTGGGSLCMGAPGVHIVLNGSNTGINYQLYNGLATIGSPVAGTGGIIDFGAITTAGVYTVVATNATTGCTSNMAGSATVVVNPLPVVYTVTGGGTYCAGGSGFHIGLSGSQSGVNYQLYNGINAVGSVVAGTGNSLDFGIQTTAGIYTVAAANATTACASNMTGSATIVVNPVPSAYSVTGGGSYCTGGTGVPVTLSGSNSGINYQLYYGATAEGSPVAGTGAGLDFGLQTTAGTYTVLATNATTGCALTMTGGVTVAINPLPVAYTVTGGGSYCAGGSGMDIMLGGSQAGVKYQLYNGLATVGSEVSGTGSALDFGLQTAAGVYTVAAVNTTTTCTNNMTGSATIVINPLPTVYTVTGGGGYCTGGSGVAVSLSGSDAGVNYQLYNGISMVGSSVPGTGLPLSFGLQTAGGVYTVVAATAALCPVNMSGSATVTVNFLPTVYTVLGGGSYCAGGTGVDVSLSGSNTGINYQLYNGTSPVSIAIPGTGAALDFGLQAPAGTYTVVATNATTTCTSNMNGSATVAINPLPTVYAVTGGGGYCPGGNGVHVGLSGSAIGITYQLYVGINAVGGTVAGTGNALDFGLQSTTGNYTVIATNLATHCTMNMSGSATVFINLLPTVYTVTGTGSYCAGGSGVHVFLNGSDNGINYQLYLNGTIVGTPLAGTGNALDFGLQTAPGNYTVVATNATTTCTSNMAASATISINPLPFADTVSGGGNYCSGGTGVDISLDSSDAGISYQLYNGLVQVGVPIPGNGSALDFGLQTTAGTYTILATNTVTNCTMNMDSSATVVINPLPTVYTVGGGGSYCFSGTGVDITLSNSDVGIKYQLYNGNTTVGSPVNGTGVLLHFGLQTAAGTYSVMATNAVTLCTNNMSGSASVIINPLPTVYMVGGGGSYCSGGPGVHITLNGSDTGIKYQLYYGSSTVGNAIAGTGATLDFGSQTTAGTYSVSAMNRITFCDNNMGGSATVSINPLPVVYTVTNGGSYCVGGAGVSIGLNGSDTGISYQLYNGSVMVGTPIAGNSYALDFGLQTVAGLYTVVATNTSTHCTSNMSGSGIVVINPLPTVYSVTGGGAYCAGNAGVHIGLSGSNTGIRYQLYNGYTPVGSPLTGTGTALDFGLLTATGTYNVIATNIATTCTNNMSGSATVSINPLPVGYTVTGGGAYCVGSTGVAIGLSGSQVGMDYQLYNGSSMVGNPFVGTGSAISYGVQTVAGVYMVIATNPLTSCTNDMYSNATVTVNPLPTVYTVTGGGAYCAGGTGVHVGLNGSVLGASYQLYIGSVPVSTPVIGTGSVLDFGLQAAAGTYEVYATNPVTGCTVNMSGSATVIVNVLPTVFTVTGGGSYCSGGTGIQIGLSGSGTGILYTLFNGASVAGSHSGTGAAIDFGVQTVAGTYSVLATNSATTCTSNMSGSAVVTVIPSVTPAVSIVAGTSDTICAGTSATFTALAVNGGSTPVYEWKINGVDSGSLSSYIYSPANGDAITVTMVSNATCATPSIVVSNPITMTVLPKITPSVSVTANPGDNVCKNTLVTYTANPVGGGAAPSYNWILNGTSAGSGQYYFNTPSNGDVIVCAMTSNYACRIGNIAFSSNLTMTVTTTPEPSVSIVANPGLSIGIGTTDSLTAVVSNSVTSPTYQWYLNGGIITNATSATYVNSNYYNNDSVSCQVTGTGICGDAVGSASVIIHIKSTGVTTITSGDDNIRVQPNPNKGDFTIQGALGSIADQEITLEITDMLGQVVYKDKVMIQNGKLNQNVQLSSTIASGMYLLTLHSDTDNRVFHIVVEQ